MKELYSFDITREITTKVPYVKKTAKGEVEAFKKSKKKKKNRIIIEKPSVSDVERGEFFYGQKYSEYINAGFLTKAMMTSKVGNGENSAFSEELKKAVLDNIEASKVISFYDGSDSLNDEQKAKLDDAKSKFTESQMLLVQHESLIRDQFSQTAEAKAEERMLEWFIFYNAYYEDEVEGVKELFPIFEGNDFEEKRESYLTLSEEEDEIDDEGLRSVKGIFDEAFETVARVINIWYNKMGSNQKEIEKQISLIFGSK